MQIRGYGKTDSGKLRQLNQDALHVDDALGLYVVADGMGGHSAGGVAAATAVQLFRERIARRRDLLEDARAGRVALDAIEALVAEVIREVNVVIWRAGSRLFPKDCMGTTLTALLFVGDRVVVGHVGDSRAYLWRHGRVVQLTEDHTLLNELRREGALALAGNPLRVPEHVLARAIGARSSVAVDVFSLRIRGGDRFLVCSDGLTRELPGSDWLPLVLSRDRVRQLPAVLVGLANAAGGSDNITAVVVEVTGPRADRRRKPTMPRPLPREALRVISATPR